MRNSNNPKRRKKKSCNTLVSPTTIAEGSAHDVTVRNTTSIQN